MTQPHWEEEAAGYGSEFDRVVLGGVVLPGVWRCDFEVARDLDVKKAKGVDGARFEDNGYEPTPITLSGAFVSREDWVLYQDAIGQLHPRIFKSTARNKERSVLTLEHPNATIFGIREVYLIAIAAPSWDQLGTCNVGFRVIQAVRSPKRAPKAKNGSDSETAGHGISMYEIPPRAIDRFPGMVGVRVEDINDIQRPVVVLPQIAPA